MAFKPPFEGTGNNLVSRALGDVSGALGAAGGFLNNQLAGNIAPSPSGLGTRQSQVPANRDAFSTRQVMRWLVPEQPIVEMYINPQSINTTYKKHITTQRTKGGYVGQYWGEDLTKLAIKGTTGTSGIEGINVLLDVYRNEQLMFDPYALFLQAERDKAEQENFDSLLFGNAFDDGTVGGALAGLGSDILEDTLNYNITGSQSKPSLASLAFTVELYWSGEVYRGFFESFDVTESSENIGLFDYNINFTVTQKRGYRSNFFAWHKHPSHGQSNSSNHTNRSYNRLVSGPQTPQSSRRDPGLFQAIAEGANQIINNLTGDSDPFLLP